MFHTLQSKTTSLQLLLFEAERLYAFAQELYRSEQHHKAISKYRRCILWANRLLSLCEQLPEDQFSASSLCEVLIYTHILNGNISFKRDQFEMSMKYQTAAYYLLLLLQENQKSSRDQALANVFIDAISPEIRFSSHELGAHRSYDVPKLVDALGPKNCMELIPKISEIRRKLIDENSRSNDMTGGGSRDLKPWLWEGEPIPIRNPELVDALYKVQKVEEKASLKEISEKHSGGNRIRAYDAVLQVWTDAEDVARKLMESNQVRNFNLLFVF